jgi:hypothetical protein
MPPGCRQTGHVPNDRAGIDRRPQVRSFNKVAVAIRAVLAEYLKEHPASRPKARAGRARVGPRKSGDQRRRRCSPGRGQAQRGEGPRVSREWSARRASCQVGDRQNGSDEDATLIDRLVGAPGASRRPPQRLDLPQPLFQLVPTREHPAHQNPAYARSRSQRRVSCLRAPQSHGSGARTRVPRRVWPTTRQAALASGRRRRR